MRAVWWWLVFLGACGSGKVPSGEGDASSPGDDSGPADGGGQDAGLDAAVGQDAAPDAAAIVCGPTAGGPFWVLEGDEVSFPLSCTTGLALQGDAFALEGLPAGVRYDAATATVSWRPGLDQAAVYDLELDVPTLGETGVVRVGVLERWNHPENVPLVDAALYTEEYGLPVFHLMTDPGINADDYTPAVITFRGHRFAAEAKYRGGASLGYPKLSFTLKFPSNDRFSEPACGFADRRKVVLTTTFDDNSYVRQRMAFELWNRLDPGHLQIRQASAVVFVNGEYRGLYALTDHVDRFFVADEGLSPDGNLYKAIDHDGNFRLTSIQNDGAPKRTLHDGYEKKEGAPVEGEAGAFADLEELVTFVATASSEDFLSELPLRVDQRDYEDWWIFVSFIQADDSAGKNSYHYHDPTGGLWRYAPWDFNASFGQTWQSARQGYSSEPEEFAWANEIFDRMFAEPTLAGPLFARYRATLDGAFTIDRVTALFDEMQQEILPSARRDEERWMNEYRTYGGWSWRDDFTTYDEEVVYTRGWLRDRWDHLDAHFQ